ncbi:F-box only protein 36a isoform X2 [Melanotaenia boesemani]|uniref:F-box only protein 36a isoform X2 n=1 Tax=Melanotaenia boesemani TaxID=1250792 RepID=UPI001C057467|nr:F-box only protein 36a isoform X2 [Melanotaenia boesemani]
MASLFGEQVFQVIWTTWNISLRRECRGTPPKQLQTTHQDFLHEKMLQYEVGFVFGERILNYIRSLCQGKFDYLERLPEEILLRILSYLELKDTTILAQVSHRFQRLCNSEEFWEQTVRDRCTGFTYDMEGIANAMGWKRTFFTFFHKNVITEEQ